MFSAWLLFALWPFVSFLGEAPIVGDLTAAAERTADVQSSAEVSLKKLLVRVPERPGAARCVEPLHLYLRTVSDRRESAPPPPSIEDLDDQGGRGARSP